jgi:hypothetical protein
VGDGSGKRPRISRIPAAGWFGAHVGVAGHRSAEGEGRDRVYAGMARDRCVVAHGRRTHILGSRVLGVALHASPVVGAAASSWAAWLGRGTAAPAPSSAREMSWTPYPQRRGGRRGRQLLVVVGMGALYRFSTGFGDGAERLRRFGAWVSSCRARSANEIVAAYPELEIVDQRPEWMSADELDDLTQSAYDINGAPWGMLSVVLAHREHP